MASIHRTTIRDQLYQELKLRIVSRVYQAGTRLNIDRLARELSVSNTPLREALTRLESDGLVITRPNQGTRVAELDAQSVTELIQTMYAILLGAYQLCLDQDTEPELLKILEDRLRDQYLLLAQEDGHSFLQAGLSFERGFLEATANKRLLALYDQLAAMFCILTTTLGSPSPYQHERENREENLRQHQAILTAVSRHDQEALRVVLARHYRQPAPPNPPIFPEERTSL